VHSIFPDLRKSKKQKRKKSEQRPSDMKRKTTKTTSIN
jgi:hypothetical protein